MKYFLFELIKIVIKKIIIKMILKNLLIADSDI